MEGSKNRVKLSFELIIFVKSGIENNDNSRTGVCEITKGIFSRLLVFVIK